MRVNKITLLLGTGVLLLLMLFGRQAIVSLTNEAQELTFVQSLSLDDSVLLAMERAASFTVAVPDAVVVKINRETGFLVLFVAVYYQDSNSLGPINEPIRLTTTIDNSEQDGNQHLAVAITTATTSLNAIADSSVIRLLKSTAPIVYGTQEVKAPWAGLALV